MATFQVLKLDLHSFYEILKLEYGYVMEDLFESDCLYLYNIYTQFITFHSSFLSVLLIYHRQINKFQPPRLQSPPTYMDTISSNLLSCFTPTRSPPYPYYILSLRLFHATITASAEPTLLQPQPTASPSVYITFPPSIWSLYQLLMAHVIEQSQHQNTITPTFSTLLNHLQVVIHPSLDEYVFFHQIIGTLPGFLRPEPLPVTVTHFFTYLKDELQSARKADHVKIVEFLQLAFQCYLPSCQPFTMQLALAIIYYVITVQRFSKSCRFQLKLQFLASTCPTIMKWLQNTSTTVLPVNHPIIQPPLILTVPTDLLLTTYVFQHILHYYRPHFHALGKLKASFRFMMPNTVQSYFPSSMETSNLLPLSPSQGIQPSCLFPAHAHSPMLWFTPCPTSIAIADPYLITDANTTGPPTLQTSTPDSLMLMISDHIPSPSPVSPDVDVLSTTAELPVAVQDDAAYPVNETLHFLNSICPVRSPSLPPL